MDEDIRGNIEMMEKFGNTDTLQQSMSAAELAGLFGMETQMVEQFFLLYSVQSGTDKHSWKPVCLTKLTRRKK